MCIGLYGPLKQEVGASSPGLIFFINHNFHGFHGLDVDGFTEIGADGVSVRIKIFRFTDVDRIPKIGIPHTDGPRKIVGAVLRFAIDLGVHGKITDALHQGITGRKCYRAVVPVYGMHGTHLFLCFFGTGEDE